MMRILVLAVIVLAVTACAPDAYYQGRQLLSAGLSEDAVAAFQQAIERNPRSAQAWREAGVAWYNLGQYASADSALAEASRLAPDLRTTLYQGLVCEALGDDMAALQSYRQVLGLRPERDVRRLAHTHFEALVRKQAEQQAQLARVSEAAGHFTPPPENTIAVVAFDCRDLPAELAPIGKGLADFLALDLGKVASLRVVERLQIDRIVNEHALMSSGFVDPNTRVRTGQLLGTRRLVTGSIQAPSSGQLELYGAVADVAAAENRDLDPVAGAESGFFRLEKALVFAVIEDLGLTLTAAERDAIETVPTESLAAFLAYSRGLMLRDEGRYSEAATEFQKAQKADGGFKEAAAMAELADDVADAAVGDGSTPSPDAGVGADGQVGRFLTLLYGESGVFPISLVTDAGGPPSVEPPRTGSITGVQIVIGGDYR
jgi:tetratricopeptide (TPR) repeat protein